MKKHIYLLLIAFLATMSFSLTSCSDKDDEPSNGNIVGSWQVVDGIANAMDGEQYSQFREDGTYYDVMVYSDDWANLTGKYYAIKGTWTLDGDKLKISGKNEITIKKISKNDITIVDMGIEVKMKRVSDEMVNEYIKLAGKK